MKKIKHEQMGFKGIHLLNPGEMNQLIGSKTFCPKGDTVACKPFLGNIVTCAIYEVSCRPTNSFTATCSSFSKFNASCNKFTISPKP